MTGLPAFHSASRRGRTRGLDENRKGTLPSGRPRRRRPSHDPRSGWQGEPSRACLWRLDRYITLRRPLKARGLPLSAAGAAGPKVFPLGPLAGASIDLRKRAAALFHIFSEALLRL
jgi:hypothetical protein